MSTIKDCFACTCLNVTIVVEVGPEEILLFDAADDGNGKLREDVTLKPGTSSQIIVVRTRS